MSSIFCTDRFRQPGLIRSSIATAALLCLANARGVAAPHFEKTEVWGLRDKGYASHFVYGIGVTWNDTILIACEGRVGGADAGEKDLLLKRSTDQGATWTDDTVIEGANDTHSWSNPTFVSDGVTTYLLYGQSVTSDLGRVFVRSTVDNGVTWSERTEITHLWNDNPHGWTQLSSIGHGIKKLKEPHRGRVMVALHHRGRVDLPPARRGYGNDVIHLTANGWAIAGGPPLAPHRGTNEARLAERADGSVYFLARQAVGDNQLRARSESTDGGLAWSAWTTQADLRGTVCDGGLLRFSDTCHLVSFPDGDEKSAQKRRNLVVKASADGGMSWGPARLVHEGQATYSDLARDSFGNIYCLYGGDGTHFMGDRVYVARFNLEWVTGVATPTLVIDNTDSGFSTQGDWTIDADHPGYLGINYAIARSAEASATWVPGIPAAGRYEVYLRWPAAKGLAAAVSVDVSHLGKPYRGTIDQRVDGGAWQYIGTFSFSHDGEHHVRIHGADTGAIAADAVMFQMQ